MDAVERRAEKRVRPPGDAVTDFALWPAQLVPPSRLALGALGPPLVRCQAGDALVLDDIAAIGLGISLGAACAGRLPADCPAVYLYLRLRDYRPQVPNGLLSLFFHASIARARPLPDGLVLGLRITHQGRGSSHDKALELLDVHRFGVPELVAWIDALARDQDRPGRLPGPGLDIDRLLDEPECAAPLAQR